MSRNSLAQGKCIIFYQRLSCPHPPAHCWSAEEAATACSLGGPPTPQGPTDRLSEAAHLCSKDHRGFPKPINPLPPARECQPDCLFSNCQAAWRAHGLPQTGRLMAGAAPQSYRDTCPAWVPVSAQRATCLQMQGADPTVRRLGQQSSWLLSNENDGPRKSIYYTNLF